MCTKLHHCSHRPRPSDAMMVESPANVAYYDPQTRSGSSNTSRQQLKHHMGSSSILRLSNCCLSLSLQAEELRQITVYPELEPEPKPNPTSICRRKIFLTNLPKNVAVSLRCHMPYLVFRLSRRPSGSNQLEKRCPIPLLEDYSAPPAPRGALKS